MVNTNDSVTRLFVYVILLFCLATAYVVWVQHIPPRAARVSVPVAALGRLTLANDSGSLDREIAQRNRRSRELNNLRQKLGQEECRKRSLADGNISTSGGWCETLSRENGGKHKTDIRLVGALVEVLAGKRVASFGDGPGWYKALLDDTGKLIRYDAYDGAPFCDVTSDGRVSFLDLTLQQFGLPVYDYVVSLEVAEHIPAVFEYVYLDNIFRHAREGVVISWARPAQPGFQHVNGKDFSDVKKLFMQAGFEHDEETSYILKQAADLPWLRNNINIFRRRGVSSVSEIDA